MKHAPCQRFGRWAAPPTLGVQGSESGFFSVSLVSGAAERAPVSGRTRHTCGVWPVRQPLDPGRFRLSPSFGEADAGVHSWGVARAPPRSPSSMHVGGASMPVVAAPDSHCLALAGGEVSQPLRRPMRSGLLLRGALGLWEGRCRTSPARRRPGRVWPQPGSGARPAGDLLPSCQPPGRSFRSGGLSLCAPHWRLLLERPPALTEDSV